MIHPFQVTKGVMMRGTDEASRTLLSYVDLEARVPTGHPLRKIRQIVNDALASLDAEFDALYLRANKLAITVFDSYEDILDKCADAWNLFANDPVRITSITHREWIAVN